MPHPTPRLTALAAGLSLFLIAGCSQQATAPSATNAPSSIATSAPTGGPSPSATATPQPSPTRAPSTATPTAAVPRPTAAPSPVGTPAAAGYRGVQSQGLSFEVPSKWMGNGDPALFEDPVSGATIGVNVVPWSPGMEPEAALPNHSVVTNRVSLSLPWGTGAEYRLERSAPAAQGGPQGVVVATEVHVLVRLGNKSIVDVYSSVPAGIDPTATDQARQHLLQSVTLIGG